MSTKSEIESLVEQYLSKEEVLPNDEDGREIMLTEFLWELQSTGTDMNEWCEADWRMALLKFGFRGDDLNSAMENVASWGMVDEMVWETPSEQESEVLEGEILEAGG